MLTTSGSEAGTLGAKKAQENHWPNSSAKRHWLPGEIKAAEWLMVILTAVNLITAWAGFRVSQGQLETANRQTIVAQGQLDQMIAQQRPWVSIEPLRGIEPLQLTDTGLKTVVAYKMKGFGTTPARNVMVWFKLVVDAISPTLVEAAAKGDVESARRIVRPADVQEELINLCNGPHAIEDVWKKSVPALNWGRVVFPDEYAENTPILASTDANYLSSRGIVGNKELLLVRLLVCVNYQNYVDNERHKLARSYVITLNSVRDAKDVFMIPTEMFPVAADQFNFMVDTLNAGFAN